MRYGRLFDRLRGQLPTVFTNSTFKPPQAVRLEVEDIRKLSCQEDNLSDPGFIHHLPIPLGEILIGVVSSDDTAARLGA